MAEYEHTYRCLECDFEHTRVSTFMREFAPTVIMQHIRAQHAEHQRQTGLATETYFLYYASRRP